MSETKVKQEPKTKSLDELLQKKKASKKEDENDNMRSKMNRLKKANSVFDDTTMPKDDSVSKAEHDKALKALEDEKKKIERDLKEASKKLKKLYALKYQDVAVINKKDDSLSKQIQTKLDSKVDAKEESANLKALQEEKAKLDDYIAGLTSALNKVKEEKDKQDEKLASINEDLNKVKEEKEASVLAISKLNEQINELEEEKKALLEKDNNYKDLDKKYQDFDEKIEKVNSAKLKEQEKNKALNEKNNSLKEELQKSKAETRAINKEYKNLLKENDKLKQECEKIGAKVIEKENENKNLEASLQEANANIAEISQKYAEANDKNEILLDVTEGLSSEFRNYEAKDVEDLNYKKVKDQEIEELNEKINALTLELENKNKEIEEFKNRKEFVEIDELTEQLDSKDFEISQLLDEKRELTSQNEVIPELNQRIKELEEDLDKAKVEFSEFKKLHENEDSAIEASIYDELKEIQAECDQATALMEEMKAEKEGLEHELEIAYQALQDQEEILSEQQRILDQQQFVIDKKMDDYFLKEKKFREQEEMYKLDKAEYDKDRQEYQEYIQAASSKQDDIFKSEYSIDSLKKELEETKAELDKEVLENKKLKEEYDKNLEVLNQYLSDIHASEARIDDLVDSLANKEVDVDNYKNKLASLQEEYDNYKENSEENIRELENELEKLNAKLNSINSDNEKLSISKFNESRLQSRIFELENNIKILSLKQENNQESTLSNSLDQYRNLLANEREAHSASEEKLTNELNNLRDQFNVTNEKLEKYTSNYFYIALSKQISTINDINDDIKENGVDMNRDIYTKYYALSLKVNEDQAKLYNSEIEKRNEYLSQIKAEKEQELQELSQEADSNVVRSYTYNKIRLLYKQIKDIDLLLNSQIKLSPPLSIASVEEEILKVYKKKLITYHRQMEENIKNLQKNLNERYDDVNSIDKLVELYDTDCEEMASGYAKEIEKLKQESNFDNNPLSRIIKEEKIILLSNEFQTLVNLRDQKYVDVASKLQEKSKTSALDSYNSSIASYDAIKENLEDKMASLEEEAKNALNLISDEKKHLEEDMGHLTDQLDQLNSFGDEAIVAEDRKKVKVLLAGKQERLDYLTNIKSVETEKHYNEMLSQIKDEYNKVLADISASKTTYEKRSDNIKQSKKVKISSGDVIKRVDTYDKINSYLLDLNNIDEIFASVVSDRESLYKNFDMKKQEKEENIASSNEFITKYQSLWKLYDKYVSAKKVMQEDFENIREYEALKIEASGAYRKYVTYQKSLANLEERIKMGLDVAKNDELLHSNEAKANTLKNRVDYLNNQVTELIKGQNVSAYIELCNKIDEIIRLIKQMDNEFKKYIK